METFENICCIVIVFLIILLGVLGFLCLFWHLTVGYYCKYKLYRRKNKIQWRCTETKESIKRNRLESGIQVRRHECYLEYRILPSEVNKFVRIFGSNDWLPGFDSYIAFSDGKEQFRSFVSNYKTYGAIKDSINKDNGVLWYEPEE